MSGRGYAQIHEDKVMHLARSAQRSQQSSRQHSPNRQQSQQQQPQQQQRDQRGYEPQSARDSRQQSQQHSPQQQPQSRQPQSSPSQPQQQSQQQQRPSTAQSSSAAAPSTGRAPTTWIAGFSSMSDQDYRPKTAAGSGGEKTLRHRMFPFHDLAADGDPHRPMLRSTEAVAVPHPEHEDQRAHGTNVINHPFVANPPAFTKPPPPRPTSEFDMLMAPEVFKNQLAQGEAQEAWSTKHKPRYAARQAAAGPTALDPAPAAPLGGGKGRPPNPSNPHFNDPSRAGLHSSREIQWTERTSRGIGQFHGYSDAKPSSYNHLASSLGGSVVPFVEHAQPASKERRSEPVRDAIEGHAFDSRPAQGSYDPHAGAGGRAPEHRPGSKAIAPQNMSLRQSHQVATLLAGGGASSDALVAEESARRDARALKLNQQMRDRDWGQHQKGYDIVTLAGAGGQDGRGPVTDIVASQQRREEDRTRAGMSSVAQHRKMIPVVVGGQQPVRGSYTPNQLSSLTNQCQDRSAGGGEQQPRPTYRPLAPSQNQTSDVMWNALHGR